MENLYNLVNKTMSNDTKLSKVQFGYTVDTYNGVLEALYNARAKLVKNSGGGAGATDSISGQPNAILKRWTELQSIEVGGVVSGDGFVVGEGNDYEKYRQQQVRILSYMPFVVERPKDGKKVSFYSPFEIGNENLDTRGQAASGKHTFPVKDMDPEKCKNIGINLGSINNPFEIGIGVDLGEGGAADTFFEKCYNKIYSKGCAAKLAEIHALCAEVAFPHGGNADAVNIKVTVNSGASHQNVAHTIYFPLPLLLTNTFNTLGTVNVNFGDKTITVGQEDTSYPFAGSKFNHLDSTLDGYTPQYVKDIVSDASRYLTTKDNVTVGYNSKTYSLGSGEGCYVRFYIDKNKEAEAVKILGKDIPKEYQNEIFKGIREAKMGEEVIGYEESGGYGSITDVIEVWEEIGKQLKHPLTGNQISAAVNLQGKWESGSKWGMWEICGKGNGDGEGVSAGKFQCTQRAGGIKKWKKYFLARGGTISSDFSSAIDRSITGIQKGGGKDYLKLTYSDASELLGFAKEFAIIGNTKEGMLAQLDVWKEEKGNKTIEIYNMFDCTTVAEFSALFGAVNHHPIIKKDFTKWKDYCNNLTGVERAKMFEKIHWAAIANYYYKRTATPDTITPKYILGLSAMNGEGWRNRYVDVMNNYKTMG